MAEPVAQVRRWKTISRVTWGTACLVGLAVAVMPKATVEVTSIAMALGAVAAFLLMTLTARSRAVSLARPPSPTPSLTMTVGVIVASVMLLLLTFIIVGTALYLARVAPGIALVAGTAIGGVGAELIDAVLRRTSV